MADADTTQVPSDPGDDPVTAAALAVIEAEVPGAVVASQLDGPHPWIQVGVDHLRGACRALKEHADTQLDCCHLISGVDWPDANDGAGEMEAVYHLVSYRKPVEDAYRTRPVKNDPFVALKVRVPRDKPEVPTVMDIWTGADWHERETWDLCGIRFTGRQSLHRILLPEDWPGHPLRKDWVFPASYHGVPIIPPEGM